MGNNGKDLRYSLVEWTGSQEGAERLAAQILMSEQFNDVEPMHPLGGPDGKKDLKCSKDGTVYVVGCYFPRGQQKFSAIRSKFLGDLEGVKANNVDGFIFVTNQEISVSERAKLEEVAEHPIKLFHLERVINILMRPEHIGNRREYLGLDISIEEMVSFFGKYENTIVNMSKLLERMSKAYEQGEQQVQEKQQVQGEQQVQEKQQVQAEQQVQEKQQVQGEQQVQEKQQVQAEQQVQGKQQVQAEQQVQTIQRLVPLLNASDNKIKPRTYKVPTMIRRGEVYFADLGSTMDSEIDGVRPVVIVSNYINNKHAPFVTIVPITGKIDRARLPTQVNLGKSIHTHRRSIAMAEQIRTIGKQRIIKKVTTLDEEVMRKLNDAISIQMELTTF
ncbi:TPA: type II toxin-antitoxin system PemK/MazF family toxin [Bacillus mycoides]|nr:type II toxin-antitoxin system PemK/MazF family toxin [Bacillus mycoides]